MVQDHAVAHATVAADQVGSFETHGIEPIPLSDRHGSPVELFRMWIGANVNYVVVVTGALAITGGLSFWQAISAVVVGNILGCLMVGLSSIQGPRTGTSGIMTSRACFGQIGSFLPQIVSLISALSWFSIQSVVATDAVIALFQAAGLHGGIVPWIALFVILGIEILLALYGHATILAAEKWFALILAILFIGLAYFVLSKSDINTIMAFNSKGSSFSSWLLAMGIALAYPLGWANFASDYSRYLPTETSWKRIALAAGGGQFVALVFCEVIGIMFAAALGGELGNDPVSQLGKFLPVWYDIPLLFAIILGGVGANVPNGYTASLGMLALRFPINRFTALGIITVFTLAVRIITVFYGEFYNIYEQFLGYMVFWTGPWAAVVIVDYFMRRGRYERDAWMRWGGGAFWYDGGFFWPGVVAFFVGIAGSLAFSNSDTFASRLMTTYLGWGDLSAIMGIVIAAVVYWALAQRSPHYKVILATG